MKRVFLALTLTYVSACGEKEHTNLRSGGGAACSGEDCYVKVEDKEFVSNRILIKLSPETPYLLTLLDNNGLSLANAPDEALDDLQKKIPAMTGIFPITNQERNGASLALSQKRQPKASDLWFSVELNEKREDLLEFTRALAKNDKHISAAQPDFVLRTSDFMPNDPKFGELWGLHNTGANKGKVDADIDAPEAWDTTKGSRNVIVAVIDTGVDYKHPDLVNNMWRNTSEVAGNGKDDDNNGYIDDVYGYDFANNDSDPMDDHFHGTHCAGTIGAQGHNGIGVVGVAHQVQMMALKFMTGAGSGQTSGAVAALRYALDNGAQITSNSWGGGGTDAAIQDAINDLYEGGVLTVAAAGNSNVDAKSFAPANMDHVLTVAASDNADLKASFSNFGNVVEITAPGVNIHSTFPTTQTDVMKTRNFATHYGTISGTSMAAPHVAGVAALVLAKYPTYKANEIAAHIMHGSDNIYTTNPAYMNRLGTGRLNAAKALTMPGLGNLDRIIKVETQVQSSRLSLIFTLNLRGIAKNLRVSLQSTSSYIKSLPSPQNLGEVGPLDNEIFQFDLDLTPGTPGGSVIPVTLVFASNNATIKDEAFQIIAPSQDRKWAKSFSNINPTVPPILYDLNGDGIQEIIFITAMSDAFGIKREIKSEVWALNGNGDPLPGFPIIGQNEIWAAFAVGDMNKDGKGEIAVLGRLVKDNPPPVYAKERTIIHAFTFDGKELPGFPFKTDEGKRAFYGPDPADDSFALALADLYGDGFLQIITRDLDQRITNRWEYFKTLRVLKHDGQMPPGWPVNFFIHEEGRPPAFGNTLAIGDLDGDGVNEIVVDYHYAPYLLAASLGFDPDTETYAFTREGKVHPKWKGKKWGYPHGYEDLTLTDVDGSGRVSLLQGQTFAYTYRLLKLTDMGATASFVMYTGDASETYEQIVTSDLFRKGEKWALRRSTKGEIVAVRPSALNAHATGWPVKSITYDNERRQRDKRETFLVGDVDGDKLPEVIFQSNSGNASYLEAWNHDGTRVPGFPRFYSDNYLGNFPVGMALGDVDGDGKVDLVSLFANELDRIAGKATVSVLSFQTPYDVKQMDWPQRWYDAQRSANPDLRKAPPTGTPTPIATPTKTPTPAATPTQTPTPTPTAIPAPENFNVIYQAPSTARIEWDTVGSYGTYMIQWAIQGEPTYGSFNHAVTSFGHVFTNFTLPSGSSGKTFDFRIKVKITGASALLTSVVSITASSSTPVPTATPTRTPTPGPTATAAPTPTPTLAAGGLPAPTYPSSQVVTQPSTYALRFRWLKFPAPNASYQGQYEVAKKSWKDPNPEPSSWTKQVVNYNALGVSGNILFWNFPLSESEKNGTHFKVQVRANQENAAWSAERTFDN